MAEMNLRKVAMIGCGFVGSATCFALMQSGRFSEMVLIDANQAKAEGEALDISHGLPFAKPMKIYAGTYDDIADGTLTCAERLSNGLTYGGVSGSYCGKVIQVSGAKRNVDALNVWRM